MVDFVIDYSPNVNDYISFVKQNRMESEALKAMNIVGQRRL